MDLTGLYLCVFLAVIQHCTSQFDGFYSNTQDQCNTGLGDEGTCISLRQCSSLDSQFQENANNRPQLDYLIKQFGCGFRQKIPYVCCPSKSEPPPSWQTERPRWPEPTKQPPTRRPSEPRQPYNPEDPEDDDDRPWPWNQPREPQQTTTPYSKTTTPRRTSPKPSTTRRPQQTPRPRQPPKPQQQQTLRNNHRNRKLLSEDICGVDLGEKILGGTNAGLSEFPWMSLIQYTFASGRSTFGCGGSLISPRYVLTAAHCIKGPDIPSSVRVSKVRLGEWDTSKERDCQASVCSPPVQDMDIETIITHKDYQPRHPAQYNDIALIRLRRNATFGTYVSPICIPLDSLVSKTYEGKKLIAAGWGKTSNEQGSSSDIKQKISLPVVDMESCSPFYTRNSIELRNTQMCAGGELNKDSCSGDSGGPLMSTDIVDSQVRWHVTGIVSFGPATCGKDIAAVYTRVSQYANWILDNMKP